MASPCSPCAAAAAGQQDEERRRAGNAPIIGRTSGRSRPGSERPGSRPSPCETRPAPRPCRRLRWPRGRRCSRRAGSCAQVLVALAVAVELIQHGGDLAGDLVGSPGFADEPRRIQRRPRLPARGGRGGARARQDSEEREREGRRQPPAAVGIARPLGNSRSRWIHAALLNSRPSLLHGSRLQRMCHRRPALSGWKHGPLPGATAMEWVSKAAP